MRVKGQVKSFPNEVAGLDSAVCSASDCKSKGRAFGSRPVEIDYEIISMAMLSFPLIQEVKLSVTVESICAKYLLTA